MLRAWAECHNWQGVEVYGQRYGGDARAWQLGLSLWWSVAEIRDLAVGVFGGVLVTGEEV